MPEWEQLGDEVRSGAAAASWGEFETQIFAIRPDGGLWNRYWDGERWHEWESLGGTFTGQPASSARDANRIDVMAVGRTAWSTTGGGTAALGYRGGRFRTRRWTLER